jgi:hypothetical protein
MAAVYHAIGDGEFDGSLVSAGTVIGRSDAFNKHEPIGLHFEKSLAGFLCCRCPSRPWAVYSAWLVSQISA